MDSVDDLRAALAKETNRREFAEARLARCQRQLAEAQKTIKTLTRLAASCPGINEVGVIAHAALLETLAADEEPSLSGATALR
jgi:anti-sigma factor RsiW